MITMIWAQTKTGVIGYQGNMPWHCPEDLKHFKASTLNHILVMGRNTWDSLPVKPLPNRQHVVLTSSSLGTQPDSVLIYDNMVDLLNWLLINRDNDIMIIGGGKLYKALMPYADKLIVTKLDLEAEGDTFAPDISLIDWKLVKETPLQDTTHVVQQWSRY
jgi:dihydrofolate reductase